MFFVFSKPILNQLLFSLCRSAQQLCTESRWPQDAAPKLLHPVGAKTSTRYKEGCGINVIHTEVSSWKAYLADDRFVVRTTSEVASLGEAGFCQFFFHELHHEPFSSVELWKGFGTNYLHSWHQPATGC